MTARDALTTQTALVAAALRLVDDHPDIPAGSVLRCFSRAVVLSRRAGAPNDVLARRAETLARQMLAARNTPGVRRPQPPRSPGATEFRVAPVAPVGPRR